MSSSGKPIGTPYSNTHFIDDGTAARLGEAVEDLPNDQASQLYERFVRDREAALVAEIRRACGISTASSHLSEDDETDDVAADVKAATAPLFETDDEPALETA